MLFAFTLLITLASCGQPEINANDRSVNQDSIEYLNKSLDFIRKVMQIEKLDTSFVLSDKPASLESFNCLDDVLVDTTTFSNDELQYLKTRKFHNLERWTKGNFLKIKLIDSDTVLSIFTDDTKGWDYFYKTIGHEFHTLSYPIFIRDYTYCLFYYDNNCGWLCGTGRLSLYKYEKSKWTEVKSFCDWIS